MTQHLYTVEQTAELLALHVKTVRRYIHDGRLKGRRIGKEYRITRADLETFTGGELPGRSTSAISRTRQVIASSIVDVEAISPDESQRLTTHLMASLNSRRGHDDFPHVSSAYYPETGKLRLTITASLTLAASVLKTIDTLLEAGRNRDS